MQFQKFIFLCSFIFMASFVQGQPWGNNTSQTGSVERMGNVSIGTLSSSTGAKLFVDGGGSSGATHYRSVFGTITSGSGYTYGVEGSAYNQTPSTAGRAYGVYGQAGNATAGANYGMYARLFGSNGGAGILATDDVNFSDPSGQQYLLGNKTWAGYFIGNMHVSSKIGLQTTNPQSMLSAGGDGNALYTSYFHTTSTTHGNRAVFGEADKPTGFADRVTAITGIIESGTGYATGLQGTSYTQNPSNAGRAYGLYAQAGNASDGANYGVYSRLAGSNGGAAVLGTDDVNFYDPSGQQYLLGNKTWAGYFIGNVEVTNAVGIGCTNMNQPINGGNQTYRLFVDGGIAARALIIQNGGNWCDYVFEKEYDLTPLEEVEQHIQEKGHLHNTPSAAEIKANEGFEIGDITLNQQEKIEEIFLHLIEMKKEIKALKAENEALKAKK